MKKLLLLLCCSFAAVLFAVDEPDELSWENFGKEVDIFFHFNSWVKSHPAVKLPAAPAMPDKFPVIRVGAAEFKWGKWQLARRNGKAVIKGRPAHNTDHARAKMRVERSGFYRVWCKYYHIKNSVASFQLNILPGGMHSYPVVVTSGQGEYYSHRFDWKAWRTKLKDLPDNSKLPTGWLKESGYCVYLEKGDYTLELTNLIHTGPYRPREVAEVVFCADIFRDIDTIAPGAAEVAPSKEFKALWQVWSNRPGSGEIKDFHRAWRKDFLAVLAKNPPAGKAKLWASMVYFDEKYNLIGTPAAVEEYIAENQQQRKKEPKAGDFICEIEAENLQCRNVRSPWRVQEDANASGGKALFAYWGNTPDTASGVVDIPVKKRYYVWSRHRLLVRYPSPFEIVFDQNGKALGKLTYGLPAKRVARGAFFWECKSIELPAGKVNLTLTKSGGRATTHRLVDSIIITDNPQIEPVAESVYRPIGKALTLWHQGNPWWAISRKASPTVQDMVAPEKVELSVRSGDVVNAVLHLRNDSAEFITIKPSASGRITPQIRVIAYMKTPVYHWTPVVLLRRKEVSAVPFQNTSLQLTFSAKDLAPGRYECVVTAGKKVRYIINVQSKGKQSAAPLAGMWCAPLPRKSCWELFRDIGVNIVHRTLVSVEDMQKYGIKLLVIGAPTPEAVKPLLEPLMMLGLEFKHWTAIISDEPNKRTIDKWIKCAGMLRKEFPGLQVWCNPGEVQSSNPEMVKRMAPYIDVFCPYVNHFNSKNREYVEKTLPAIGKIKLTYSTPCFHEKSPASPMAMFSVARIAKKNKRHGFNFFSSFSCYTYSNSIWDEMNAMSTSQSINFYPGNHGGTLSTRNLEAVREAIQEFRNE